MSHPTTAPELASLQAAVAARAVTPTNQMLDMDGVRAWFAEQAGKPGTPMTPKEMQAWDEKSLLAWRGRA